LGNNLYQIIWQPEEQWQFERSEGGGIRHDNSKDSTSTWTNTGQGRNKHRIVTLDLINLSNFEFYTPSAESRMNV
jgi:hypothetical protein